MSIAQSILPEFEQEMAGTRKTLERVPEEKFSWKAHPKSNTIGWLTNHLAEIPFWVEGTLTQDSWDISPPAAAIQPSRHSRHASTGPASPLRPSRSLAFASSWSSSIPWSKIILLGSLLLPDPLSLIP
jgi:hypothetical protein